MNKRLLLNLLGKMLMTEAGAMALSFLISAYYRDGDADAFLKTIGLIALVAVPMWSLSKPRDRNLRAREAFVAVGAAWHVFRTHVEREASDLPRRLVRAVLGAPLSPIGDALDGSALSNALTGEAVS